MNAQRKKKLKAIYAELIKRKLVVNDKSNFRKFKKMYSSGELATMLPGM